MWSYISMESSFLFVWLENRISDFIYIFLYIRNNKFVSFQLTDSMLFQVFNPLSHLFYWFLSMGNWFFPRFIRMVMYRLSFNRISAFCSLFLELEDERIRIPLQSIRIRLPGIRMLFPGFGYPSYSSFNFCDFQHDFKFIPF